MGFVRDVEPPLGEELLDIAIAQPEPQKSHLVAADLERESAVYSGLQGTLYARFATLSCSSRRLQRTTETGVNGRSPALGAFDIADVHRPW
jgi:hypothetical protein